MPIGKNYIQISLVACVMLNASRTSLGTAPAELFGYVQADCPSIVKQAIDTANTQCGKTTGGKLCYGNSTISAEFQPGVDNIQFNAPGTPSMSAP